MSGRLALVLSLLLTLTLAGAWAQSATTGVSLGTAAQWHTWEAESATPVGSWQTAADPAASGGKYLEAAGEGSRLQYRFRVPLDTTLRLRPVFWRNSAQRASLPFPYPLAQDFGPAAMDYCGNLVYFTAPATGQVGLYDVAQGKLLGAMKLGGYLTDLVADHVRNVVYVSDAQNSRVLVLDGRTGQCRPEALTVAAQPWALALVGDQLFVACRGGKCVQVIELRRWRFGRTFALPAAPVRLDAIGDPPTSLVVRFQQGAVQALTLDPLTPDQQQYGARTSHGSVSPSRDVRYEVDRGKQVVKVTRSGKTVEVDVRSVTTTATPAAAPEGSAANLAGPDNLALCGTKLFFTAPQAGRVGVLDTATDKLLKSIEVGGWIADIVALPKSDKVYVADAAGDRVVILDAAKLAVKGEVKVPATPLALELAEGYTLQRPYMVPPTRIDKLFVACAGDQALAAIDLNTDQLLRSVPLGYRPRGVRLVAPPNADWWPLLADDRVPLAMIPRVAVEPEPYEITLDPLRAKPAPGQAEMGPRRAPVKLAVAGQEHTVSAPAPLTLQVDATKLDVSALCDPQVQPQQPLGAGEAPGSLTVAVDDGPEYDWRRSTWTRPDNGMMLVYGTDEYWRWNAPAVVLKPGEHTLTLSAHDPTLRLDAVQVMPTADAALDLSVLPEPRAVHGAVPGSSYQGVFYDQEPVQFSVVVRNDSERSASVTLTGTLANYLGEAKPLPQPLRLRVPPHGQSAVPLRLAPEDWGRFVLTLNLASARGGLTRDFRFVRLPKLTHPRMFFRPEDAGQIAARLARYPRLFSRYADWLKRMTPREGRYPERFLPNALTAGEMAKLAPEGTKDPQGAYGWRMYEAGWRMLATEFTARYVPGADSAFLDARLKPLLEAPKTDTWVQFHHHGPFFPGAVEGMVDMAPDGVRQNLPLTSFFAKYRGDVNVLPFTIASLEPPLRPADRAMVYEIATLHANLERYFETHYGRRGGTWWQNPWSWCYCPTQGLFLNFMFCKNLFGEERYFEKPFFRGYLTFMEYADPIRDKSNLLPALRRPSGEPWRWILASVARHPLEKYEYGFDDWIARLNGDLPQPETAAVDDLMAMKGHPLAIPYQAAPHGFNTGVAIPVALALGWYDPDAPTVTMDELPPTALFDVDGWAMMRSGWDSEATEVTYMCGARDHTCRQQPNHFTVVRGGEYLVGTPTLWADDGNNQPAWGNTVVAGENWAERWRLNLYSPRSLERAIIDRFSPVNWAYLARDRALVDYRPAEGGWGGGVDLHGHTETLMVDEGRVLAYETAPEFDYVAGEAAGAWPPEEMQGHTRQIVFLKPNVIVMYDRVTLGPATTRSQWLATTGPELAVDAQRFTIKTGEERLAGQVLWPREAKLVSVDPLPGGFYWKKQRLLQISGGQTGPQQDYLVIMTTGAEGLTPAAASVLASDGALGVSVKVDGRSYDLTFRRQGPVGGALRFARAGQTVDQPLVEKISDTYAAWKSDPRYGKWVTQPRFDFIIPAADRVGKGQVVVTGAAGQ